MADKDTTVPQDQPDQKGQTDKDKVPATPDDAGKTKAQEAPLQSTPENLKGKNTDELIKMYGELEHKLGEQGHELGQARKLQEDMTLVLQAIYADPEVKTRVEKEMNKLMGKPTTTDTKETKKPDETRLAMERQILQEFEGKSGLDTLPLEEKQKVYQRIGKELRDMVDPGGNKTDDEIMNSISLMKLPELMDKAYYLADREGTIRQAAEKGKLQAMAMKSGMIGSIPSSGGVGVSPSLTVEQKEVARKLGISEEDYTKSMHEPSS